MTDPQTLTTVRPCRVCGTDVELPVRLAIPHRPNPTCAEHSTITEDTSPSVMDLWRRRAGRWAEARLDGIPDGDTKDAASEIVTHWPNPLDRAMVLLGATGIGKTWTAYAIVNELIVRGHLLPRQVMFKREADLIGWLTALKPWERNEAKIEMFKHARVVVIDDLGYAQTKDEGRVQVMLDIMERVERKAVLIVTSNLDPESLQRAIGAAAFSRLWAMAGQISYQPDGRDHRFDHLQCAAG